MVLEKRNKKGEKRFEVGRAVLGGRKRMKEKREKMRRKRGRRKEGKKMGKK